MAGNRVVNFHPRAQRGGRLAVLGGARARRPEGRRAHLCKPVGFACGLPGVALRPPPPAASPSGAWRRIGRGVPPSRTLLGYPRRWIAPGRRSRPSWQPWRVARPRRKGTRHWAVPCHGAWARSTHTQYALPPATRVTRPPAAAWWAGARLNGAPIVASAKARRTLAAGQSPAMGHGRGARRAWGAPAASSLVLAALREGLTPPPRRGLDAANIPMMEAIPWSCGSSTTSPWSWRT